MIAVYKGGREAVMNEHRATHDLLTGLPNRMLFADRIDQAVKLGKREGRTTAVLFMDLDHFKEINDTLGHNQGDLVLRTLGPRLREVLRDSDTVASLGGDEFGILLPDATPAQASHVAGKILEGLKQPLRAEGLTLQVGASIGIACYPTHGEDVKTLLQHADVAMFAAKENRNGYEVYSGDRDTQSADRVLLASDLRNAVDSGTFTLEHQPLVDIQTQRVVGVEALARWIHEDRGAGEPGGVHPDRRTDRGDQAAHDAPSPSGGERVARLAAGELRPHPGGQHLRPRPDEPGLRPGDRGSPRRVGHRAGQPETGDHRDDHHGGSPPRRGGGAGR